MTNLFKEFHPASFNSWREYYKAVAVQRRKRYLLTHTIPMLAVKGALTIFGVAFVIATLFLASSFSA